MQEKFREVCDSCLGLPCDCGHLGLEHNLTYGSCFCYDPMKSTLCKCNKFKKTNSKTKKYSTHS